MKRFFPRLWTEVFHSAVALMTELVDRLVAVCSRRMDAKLISKKLRTSNGFPIWRVCRPCWFASKRCRTLPTPCCATNRVSTLVEMLPTRHAIAEADALYEVLLQSCQKHIMGNRTDRYEPWGLKRRAKGYKLMHRPKCHNKPVRHETFADYVPLSAGSEQDGTVQPCQRSDSTNIGGFRDAVINVISVLLAGNKRFVA